MFLHAIYFISMKIMKSQTLLMTLPLLVRKKKSLFGCRNTRTVEAIQEQLHEI